MCVCVCNEVGVMGRARPGVTSVSHTPEIGDANVIRKGGGQTRRELEGAGKSRQRERTRRNRGTERQLKT